MLEAAVGRLVLDPQVGQLEMVADHREVVRLGEGPTVLFEGGVGGSVRAVQVLLVVALELVVEDDPHDAPALTLDARRLRAKEAVDLGVVPELARLHDAGVVPLRLAARARSRWFSSSALP